jgi:predicted RNA-binding Zn-ribbon protein involved in translation (DUF1610 family)
MKNKKRIKSKCLHSKSCDVCGEIEHDANGLYISFTCPNCGDSLRDYYELVNRYNESKEIEETIADSE